MTGGKLQLKLTYRRRPAKATPAYPSGAYTTAIMRALAPFPEARKAVIAELDRIEQVAA